MKLEKIKLFMACLFISSFCATFSHSSEKIYVAGGCFWCVEADFENVAGVIGVTSGFSGGHLKSPTYNQVEKGRTGHKEAVEIEYDPQIISDAQLYDMFLRSVDVTDAGGQFCDRGEHYATGIFTLNAAQRRSAKTAIAKAERDLDQRIVTLLFDFSGFYKAEAYHQDFYQSKKIILTRFGPRTKAKAYKLYRDACGRDERVKKLWGKHAFPK